MKEFIKSKVFDSIILKTLLLIVGFGPVLYFYLIKDVPILVFILGAGSWGFGVILKMIFYQIIIVPLTKKYINTIIVSSLNGFISGITELSSAFILIMLSAKKYPIMFTFDGILSFGIGIGAIEVMVVATNSSSNLLKGTALEESSKKIDAVLDTLSGINHYLYNIGFTVVERIIATVIHVATRGLVFITILSLSVVPFMIALSVFITADGYLGYYFYVTDKFLKLEGLNRFLQYFLILAIVSSAIFIILVQPYKMVTP